MLPGFYRRNHRIYLIQDNASYHKKSEVYEWFRANRKRLEVYLLPPYSPQFNAVERIWHYTRMQSTHNRYFDTPQELCQSLFATFDDKHTRFVMLVVSGTPHEATAGPPSPSSGRRLDTKQVLTALPEGS